MPLVRVKNMGLSIKQKSTAKEFSRKYLVVVNAPPEVDTELDVIGFLAARGVFIGAPLIGYPFAVCTSVDVGIARENVRVGANGTGLWEWPVEYVFSTQPGKDPQNSKEEDPTKRLPEIDVRLVEFKSPALHDFSFSPIANSAGDPLRLDDDRLRVLFSIDKIFATYPAERQYDARSLYQGKSSPGYSMSRNLNPWKPYGPYSAIFANAGEGSEGGGAGTDYEIAEGMGLIKLSVKPHFENNTVFAKVHADVLVDFDQHVDKPWDVGFRGYSDADVLKEADLIQLQDRSTGMFPTVAPPLDGNGFQLKTGKPLFALEFQRFPLEDWAPLNLP